MENTEVIRVAYGSIPKDGGTFTFYRNHRARFRSLGVDIRCIAVGAQQAELWNDDFADDGCALVAGAVHSVKRQAEEFVSYCTDESIDIVIGVNSIPILSSIPHLPANMRVVSRCANAFPEGYRVTVAGRERISRIVALTPRLRDDLVKDYDVNPDQISLIPNGVDISRFDDRKENTGGDSKSDVLKLGFLGRLEHNQKGVFHLPKILQELDKKNVNYQFSIAGTGKHEKALKRQLQDQLSGGKVKFIGKISPEQVPEFLGGIDVFLFTSHFEGCPNALLEAMAAGCVPVSWIVKGITDFILRDGESGFLIPLDDHRMFATRIADLSSDRIQLDSMANASRSEAASRFSTQACAESYTEIFENILASEDDWNPRPWSEFQVDPSIREKNRGVPGRLKNWLKSLVGIAR